MEYEVRDAVGNIEVGGGVRNLWRGVREKGGSDEPPEPPLVTGLCVRTKCAASISKCQKAFSTLDSVNNSRPICYREV